MPLTNAEKQKRARDKRADKIARYEAALHDIAVNPGSLADEECLYRVQLAQNALHPAPSRLHSKGE